MTREPKRPIGFTAAGIAAVVLLACAYQLVHIAVDAIEMSDWVATNAVIQVLEPHQGTMTSSLVIVYAYSNGQRTCKGNRINVMENAGAGDDVKFRESFTKGKAIRIWVDPDERCRAVIDRDVPWLAVGLLAAGLVGAAGAILYIRKRGWKLT